MSLIALLFGLIIGSFLNVVILRHGARSLGGRSACLSCGAPIRWYDNVPVVSYLVLGGRCRSCKSAISVQYPLVEIATGLLFVALAFLIPLHEVRDIVLLALSWAIGALLIAIFVYDLRHTIIPDGWALSFAALALVSHLVDRTALDPWMLLLAGPAIALPIFALWFVSHGTWMGLGDAKLCLGIGWLLGIVYGVAALFAAFMLGAAVSLAILIPLPAYRRLAVAWGLLDGRAGASFIMKSEVPFAPFLVGATIIIWFFYRAHIPIIL